MIYKHREGCDCDMCWTPKYFLYDPFSDDPAPTIEVIRPAAEGCALGRGEDAKRDGEALRTGAPK